MKRVHILLAGMAAFVVSAAPASAATSTVNGTVTAGTLSIATTATPTFGVTLNGIDQVATYNVIPTVGVDVPANTHAGSYTTAITTAVVAGP
jgi:hypothetical protein